MQKMQLINLTLTCMGRIAKKKQRVQQCIQKIKFKSHALDGVFKQDIHKWCLSRARPSQEFAHDYNAALLFT